MKPFEAVVDPVFETVKSVVIAPLLEVELIVKRLRFEVVLAAESWKSDSGVEVPTPTRPLLSIMNDVAEVEPTAN